MSHVLKPEVLVLAFLSWLIPFAVSFAFFGPGGVPWLPYPLFKSIMVVVFGATGLWLMLRALRGGTLSVASGLAMGGFFLAVNVVLDIAILLPLTGMGFTSWLMDIGLRYLLIPVMGWGIGRAAEQSR
jgi:hypothetical protein